MPPTHTTDGVPIVSADNPLPGSGSTTRPPGPGAGDGTRRNHVVSVRLSAQQLEHVDKARAGSGLRRGPYLRMAAMGRLPRSIPEVNRAVWPAFGPAFEHLARVADSLLDRPRFHSEVVAREVRNLERELLRIRRELLGIPPSGTARY